MATYYVRKTGSDAVAGTSAGAAWLTIDKAANTVVAGDTVYVGAGTYREAVTMDTSGSSGSQISFIADVDGSQTGDPGLVVISAYTDSNTVTRLECWDPDGRTFITVRGFVMQGGSQAVVRSLNATNDNYEGVVFEDCTFVAGPDGGDYGINIDMNAATTPTSDGLTFRRCLFRNAGIRILWNGNETADQDLKVTVENCVLTGGNNLSGFYAFFMWDLSTAGTFASGGVSINNCVTFGGGTSVYVDNGTSTTYPVAVRNCYFATYAGLQKVTSNDGALTSDHNTYACDVPVSNVTAGGNDRQVTSVALFGGLDDMILYKTFGWSPYAPFEPIRNNSDDDWSSLIGDASATFAPADDLFGNPRPMHGTADDRGAVEGRARPEQETTTVRTGSNAMRFEGAGYHDILVPVAASATTISVYARKDTNYTGTAPQMVVTNIPGVSDITDTHTAAADTWEQLTSGSFTPTAAGVCRVRLKSNDTSATGICFFDDLELA